VNCLASAQTIRSANCCQRARRLAKLQVVGIEQHIDVFEIAENADSKWAQLCQDYEEALENFESQQFANAIRKLGTLIQEHPSDRPSRQLLTRAVTQIDQPDADFSPVWVLTRK
jgi:predicted Zn-dependent protease